MQSFRSPLIFTALAAVFVLSLATGAGASTPAVGQAAVKPASVGVVACKSSAWYAGRQLTFRARISRQDLATEQKLAIKVEIWRKLNESKRFRKIKLSGEKGWATASEIQTAIYKREVSLAPDDIETAASYRAKVSFRWSDPQTGKTQAKKTVWSKPCAQKTALPKLKITNVTSVQNPGSATVTHTVTVANDGKSEAVNIPVGVRVDENNALLATIESLGKRQSADVQITTPACQVGAAALLDPLLKLMRPKIVSVRMFAIPSCR